MAIWQREQWLPWRCDSISELPLHGTPRGLPVGSIMTFHPTGNAVTMSLTSDITSVILRDRQAGNREAFDDFYRRQTPRIVVYISYNVGPRLRKKVEPTDLLQNVYLRLYSDFASFIRRARDRGIQKALVR